MQTIVAKPLWFLALFSLLLFSTACSFKERPVDDEDNTATTTEMSITRIDGTVEELKFTAPLELDNIGINPLAFAVKDLNNDQRADLVLLNSAVEEEDQAIRIIMRTSQDTSDDPHQLFEVMITLKTGTNQRPHHLIVEDINGDGIQDIIVTNPLNDTISLWEGQRTEDQFSVADTSNEFQAGDFPTFIVADTFEDPGTIGVAIANRASDNLSILFDLTTDKALLLDEEQGVAKDPLQLVSGDWNNDGCPDLASLSSENERVDFFKNTPCLTEADTGSSQEKTFEKIGSIEIGDDPQAMIVGDWDRDGQMDLAVSNRIDDDVSLLYGNGDGSFNRWDIRVGEGPGQMAFTDFNADGVEDFVIGNLIDQDLTILLSNGDGIRPADQQMAYSQAHIASGSILAGNRPAFIKIVDINFDDKADILLTLPFEDKLSILLQK